jgi:hypothetical protein
MWRGDSTTPERALMPSLGTVAEARSLIAVAAPSLGRQHFLDRRPRIDSLAGARSTRGHSSTGPSSAGSSHRENTGKHGSEMV